MKNLKTLKKLAEKAERKNMLIVSLVGVRVTIYSTRDFEEKISEVEEFLGGEFELLTKKEVIDGIKRLGQNPKDYGL